MIDCPKCGSQQIEVGATTAERVCAEGHRFIASETGGVVPTQIYSDDTLDHMQRTTSQYDRTCRVLAADLLRARKEIGRLRDLLNRDRSGLAACLAEISRTAHGYFWIVEGRGSYAFDDDEYRKETGHALSAVIELAGRGLRESGDRANDAFHPPGRPPKLAEVLEQIAHLSRLAIDLSKPEASRG